jgi:hypothetical protein
MAAAGLPLVVGDDVGPEDGPPDGPGACDGPFPWWSFPVGDKPGDADPSVAGEDGPSVGEVGEVGEVGDDASGLADVVATGPAFGPEAFG